MITCSRSSPRSSPTKPFMRSEDSSSDGFGRDRTGADDPEGQLRNLRQLELPDLGEVVTGL